MIYLCSVMSPGWVRAARKVFAGCWYYGGDQVCTAWGLYYRSQCDHCALLGSQPHSKSTPLSARNWQMELGDGKLSELCILLNGTASNPWKAVGAEECILDRY